MATRRPKESATVLELRNISEQLSLIATQLHLLLIYKVDPGAAEIAGEGAESRGRLSADHAFVTRQRERFSGTRLAATKRLT